MSNRFYSPHATSGSPHQPTLAIVSPPLRSLGSPYTRIPLPSVDDDFTTTTSKRISLSPLLERGPRITYDLSQPNFITTQTNTNSPQSRPIPPQVLSERATHPALPSLSIVSRFLPWTIHVFPASGFGYVTVGDVFNSITADLQRTVSEDELSSILAPRERRIIDDTFERRVMQLAGDVPAYWVERSAGVRRIDFLMGRTWFMGLSERGDRWELNVS